MGFGLALRAGKLAAPAGQVHAEGPVLGDEDVGGPHRLGPGAPHAEHVPVVHDLVVTARHQAHAMIDHALAVADRHRQHVPVRGIDPAREVPEAAHHEAAIHGPPASLRVGDARGDQRIGVLAPHLFLGPLVVEREHPVMDAEVGHVPAGGGAAAGDLGRDVEEGHEVELHAAPAPGLVEPEQSRAMEVVDRLREHLARGVGLIRPLAKRRHQGARPEHRLVVAHVDEAAPGGVARLGHPRMPAACGIFE